MRLRSPPNIQRAPILRSSDLETYAEALERNGFFGPDAYYMNHAENAVHASGHVERLTLPVLFLHARYDYVCETVSSRLAEPMRTHCEDLTEYVVDSGHWMAQERPQAVNAALARWLATRLEPGAWPLLQAPAPTAATGDAPP